MVNSFDSIYYIYQIYNLNNHQDVKKFYKKFHLGDYYTILTMTNIFNYYFLNNKNFINMCNINNYNRTSIQINKIIGIGISITNKTTMTTHYTGIYKCGKKYYYYDNEAMKYDDINFRLTNNQVFIEIEFDFNIINDDFDILYDKILLLYQIKNYNNYIDEIHIFYIDHYETEYEYYSKIINNYIYYYSNYNNPRLIFNLYKNLNYIYNNVNNYKNSFLILASIKNDIELVEKLLSYENININNQNYNNETAILLACKYEHFEIAKLLLSDPRVNTHLADNNDETPLIVICKNKNIQIFNLLFSHINRADVESINFIELYNTLYKSSNQEEKHIYTTLSKFID